MATSNKELREGLKAWLKAFLSLLVFAAVLEFSSVVAALLCLVSAALWFAVTDQKAFKAFIESLFFIVLPVVALHYFGIVAGLFAIPAGLLSGALLLQRFDNPRQP